jgi:MazG family protein
VVETITAKMIRRHPHVFGQAKVASAEDVALNWAKIKAAEKGAPSSVASTLKGVPYPLPALLRAHRLGERASKVGFDWSSPQEVQEKVQEEWGELQEALDADAPERVQEELGDLLFSIVQWVRHLGFNAEHLLRLTNQKFITRFEKMEKEVQSLGLKLEDVSLERMDEAWEKAKA